MTEQVRKLSDDEVRQAYDSYRRSRRGLRAVAKDYGISHVQLSVNFARLGLERRGNRTTDPRVVDRVIALRELGWKWTDIAADVRLSLRQTQNIYATHVRS